MPTVGATDSWIWREWLDIGLGEEAVDLWDLAPEVEKFGFGLDKAPPTYEDGIG